MHGVVQLHEQHVMDLHYKGLKYNARKHGDPWA